MISYSNKMKNHTHYLLFHQRVNWKIQTYFSLAITISSLNLTLHLSDTISITRHLNTYSDPQYREIKNTGNSRDCLYQKQPIKVE